MSQSVVSTLLTPVQRYQHDLQQEGFNYDASQEEAVCCLQSLYDRLVADVKGEQPIGMLARLTGKFKASEPAAPIKGLYFWGGVGRGKTYLMDNFYESLPFEQKMRTHFHRFMRRVHRELKQLKGEKIRWKKWRIELPARPRLFVLMSFLYRISPMPCCWAYCWSICLFGG